jgi:DtxR family Mn-dependent transcriptional regulator
MAPSPCYEADALPSCFVSGVRDIGPSSPVGSLAVAHPADDDGYHTPVEEYLQAVHYLKEEGTLPIQARIAERLNRSAPSVSEMLERLADDGYVRRSGRVVELTDKGSLLAEKVVRKHRLAERLLADVIGLEWHKVHREAGRWEHVISDDVEARLVQLLGDPATCPHGNPIPGAATPSPGDVQQPLAAVAVGDVVQVARISEDVEMDMDALVYLDEHHFVPGTKASVRSRAPDGTMMLEASGGSVAIGAELSRRIYVTVP